MAFGKCLTFWGITSGPLLLASGSEHERKLFNFLEKSFNYLLVKDSVRNFVALFIPENLEKWFLEFSSNYYHKSWAISVREFVGLLREYRSFLSKKWDNFVWIDEAVDKIKKYYSLD